LLFHELATNATKYGALVNHDGRITIEIIPGDTDATLRWTESGGPPISAPASASGFGSQLMEMSAVRQLGGTVARDWRTEGLAVTITIPKSAFSRR
jgi:two-component sensor histidine kinase